jgi:hypothetical protein
MESAIPSTLPSRPEASVDAHAKASLPALTLGVFGDIGTSPLYTLRECLHQAGSGRATAEDVYGLLSLIFWSIRRGHLRLPAAQRGHRGPALQDPASAGD